MPSYDSNRIRADSSCIFNSSLSSVEDIKKIGGTVSGIIFVNTPFGKGISFDGTNDYLAFGNLSKASTQTVKSFTSWINPTSTEEQISDLNGTANLFVSGTINGSGLTSPTFYVNGVAGSAITANNWQHVSVTSDTGISPTAFEIGRISTNYGQIKLFDFRLYNKALTANEILNIFNHKDYNYEDNLVGYWDMSDINPRDKIGTNNGTGTGLDSTNIVNGHKGNTKAITFNGTNESLSLGNIGVISGLSLWFKSSSSNEEIVKLATDKIIFVSGNSILTSGITATNYLDGSVGSIVSINKWHYLVSTFNDTASALAIATDGTAFGNISVDELKVYNKVLTSIEVKDLYNKTK